MLNKKFIRFIITGFIVTAIHVTIATFLITYISISPMIANGFAFISATISSYLINTFWSFSNKLNRQNFFRFAIVSFVGLFLSMFISNMADIYRFHYLIGILFVIFSVTPVTFTLHNRWTYRCY